MNQVLLIDDDAKLAKLLTQYFQKFNIELATKLHPHSGIKAVKTNKYQALILDVMLPEMDGFEVCREIRKTHDIPIIMLTARGDTTDKIVGLEIGADDYLAKPFEPRELVARVNNLIKRATPQNSISQISNNLSIDRASQMVTVNGKSVELTTKEYALLELFIKNPGKVISRDDVLNELQGVDADYYSRSVDIAVSRLRGKLKPEQPIQTVWGRGYRFK